MMVELGPTTEQDMVLAFLRAEVDSPRFGHLVRHCLDLLGTDRGLIENANLGNPEQNLLRKRLLGGFRGYGMDAYLFRGFPTDTTWRRVRLEQGDLQTLRYANEPSWIEFSDGTRLVSVGARNANGRLMGEGPLAVAARIQNGQRFPELIAAEAHDGSLILAEGATRATAYVLANVDTVEAIVGASPTMARWSFY
jgi:hypothetical protein